MNDPQDAGRLFSENAEEEGGHGFPRGEAEDVEDIGFGDLLPAKSHQLIEHRLGVAHAAVRSFGNGPGGGVVELYALFSGDVLEMRGDDIGGDGAQVKALAAGDDGGQDFVGLGGGKDEFDVFRRFLEGFQESVEGSWREHVDLINVNDAESTGGRGEADRFEQRAYFVDLVV